MKKIFLTLIVLWFASFCFAEEEILYKNDRYDALFSPTFVERIQLTKENMYCITTVTYRVSNNAVTIFYIYSKDKNELTDLLFDIENTSDNSYYPYDNKIRDIMAKNKSKFTEQGTNTRIDEGVIIKSYTFTYLP